LKELKQYSKF
jgi:hypothetical protein